MKIFDVRILAPGVGSRVENLIKKKKGDGTLGKIHMDI